MTTAKDFKRERWSLKTTTRKATTWARYAKQKGGTSLRAETATYKPTTINSGLNIPLDGKRPKELHLGLGLALLRYKEAVAHSGIMCTNFRVGQNGLQARTRLAVFP